MTPGGSFDIEGKLTELEKLKEAVAAPDLWDDHARALGITRRLARLERTVDHVAALGGRLEDADMLLDMANEEADAAAVADVVEEVRALETMFDTLEREALYFAEYDDHPAIVSIHAGAGGVDAQDWAEMLLRMYTRYLERSDLGFEIDEIQPGDEAGIKSATLTVRGDHAYATFESERGAHRLVRISPFDSNARRHTSFAGVDVIPEVEDTEIEIDTDDLRIDTYRSQGAGGQHVNTSDSAVRITHIPTGIVVACQNERSQLQNKDRAFRILRARLYDLAIAQQQAEMARTRKNQVGTGDRSGRIRTYNFPQGRLTDHRIGLTLHKLDAVLEGEIEDIVNALTAADRAEKLSAITDGDD